MGNNNLDKLFKSKLGDDIVPYDPAAWGRMAALIDEDDDVNGNGVPPRKRHWKTFLGLALLLIVSLIGFWQFSTVSSSSTAMKNTSSNDKENWNNLNSDYNTEDFSKYGDSGNDKINNQNSVSQKENDNTNILNSNNQETKHEIKIDKSGNNQQQASINDNPITSINSTDLNGDLFTNTRNADFLSDDNPLDNGMSITESATDTKKSISGESKSLSNSDKKSEVNSENISSEDRSTLTKQSTYTGITSNQEVNRTNTEKDSQFPTSLNDQKNEDKVSLLNPEIRDGVLEFPFLKTATNKLTLEEKEIVPLMTQVNKKDKFNIGLFSSLAYNQGYISQTGIGVDYKVRPDWSIMCGLGFEYAKYNNGAIVTVQDKQYSFGSTLVDRTMTLNKRNALILPIQLKKSFDQLSVHGGVLLNYHIAANGNINNAEGAEESVWVTDNVFNPLTMSYQVGVSYILSRRLELNAGLVYRKSEIDNTVNAQNSGSKAYPSFGFCYLIAKI